MKMVMIQDGPLPTGADKPLRITGDPFKVQVGRTLDPAGPGKNGKNLGLRCSMPEPLATWLFNSNEAKIEALIYTGRILSA